MALEPRTNRERFSLGVLLSPGVFWLLIFFMIPLGVIVMYSFLDRGTYGGIDWEFQFENYTRMADSLYVKIFWRSLIIAIITTIICLLTGYPMAYWVATRSPGVRSALILLMVIPFWTNFVIRTYAWRFILANNGIINQIAIGLGLTTAEEPFKLLFTQETVVLGLVYGWIVGMILPCYASIVGLDRSLLEAAQDLYATPIQAFLRVTLPLTLPGVFAGSILVFIPSFGAFITPDLLGGGKADMIGNVIQQQFSEASDWPFGSALSTILMIVMLIGTFLYFRSLRADTTQV